jgi:hypothetical protein
MATVAEGGFATVQGGVIPRSGHWIMDENPTDTVRIVRTYLDNGP